MLRKFSQNIAVLMDPNANGLKCLRNEGAIAFTERPVGRYYRPLVDNQPFCLNGRYS